MLSRNPCHIVTDLLQIRVWPSERRLRAYEAGVTAMVAREKVDKGKMPLFKNATADTATLIPYVKVVDLITYFEELIKQVSGSEILKSVLLTRFSV